MRTKHIDKHIEAYLDNQLSAEMRQQVDLHLKQCPTCARLLADAQWINRELGPVLRAGLGKPSLPPLFRRTVRQAITQQENARPFYLNWSTPVKVVNGVATAAIVAFLAFGAYSVVRGQIPGGQLFSSSPEITASNQNEGGDMTSVVPTPTVMVQSKATVIPQPTPGRASAGDTLPPVAAKQKNNQTETLPVQPAKQDSTQIIRAESPSPDQAPSSPMVPDGIIVFALYSGQMYQIHMVSPDGSNHIILPLPGVSEPTLHPAETDTALAFRSWNDPSGPRALVSGNIQADPPPQTVTHFWEDAQPDWSPTENRLIFASQRESDRRWRLYTVWGNGLAENNLRREGRSPTFAPDGYRFAFESCDKTGNKCGLWVGDLEHSEYDSKPILEDPLAKSPDWSPVGEEIVYMANPHNNWDLYVVTSNGQAPRRLTDNPAIDGLPVWSPDGEWLAFVSNRDEQWGLWLLHVASGQLERIISFDDDSSLTAPSRSPYNEHGERYWWDEQISWGLN